jgi:SH3 domain-containing YSC84-like protein 1
MRILNTLICGFSLILALSNLASAQQELSEERKDAARQTEKAAEVFRQFMNISEDDIPQSLLNKAMCVAVFPDVIKAGFIFGGRYGRGVASCRTSLGWSAPAFFNLGGGSFGLQFGAQSTDFVFLFMGDKGIDSLLKSKFELGGDASAAAGPLGRQAGASTDALLRSRILTYSRSKGLFAGVELKGTVITQDDDDLSATYGEETTTMSVLRGRIPAPYAVRIFPATLTSYSRRRL